MAILTKLSAVPTKSSTRFKAWLGKLGHEKGFKRQKGVINTRIKNAAKSYKARNI